jgi:hypothetical protein
MPSHVPNRPEKFRTVAADYKCFLCVQKMTDKKIERYVCYHNDTFITWVEGRRRLGCWLL